MVPVIHNGIPVPGLLVFLTQSIYQLIEPFGFHLANVFFKVARGVISSDHEHGNHDHHTVQEETQEYLMSEFQLH
jgi:hypothetical protein